jgi:hypothetical protein
MLPRKLEELWDEMEKIREITLGAAKGLSEADFARQVDGEWSVAEILEHLIIAETGTSKVIRKCLKDNAGKLPPYPADDSVLTVRPLLIPPGKAGKAPEAAIPTGGIGKEELLGRAAECRKQMRVSLEMLAGADPRGVEFPHILFGNLNLYEWPCILVLGHERQHHPQIEALVRKIKG